MASAKAKGSTKAPAKPADPARPKIVRKRGPFIDSAVNVRQMLEALRILGYSQIIPLDLELAYRSLSKRKVAKERNPEWLKAQLEKVTGKSVELVRAEAPPADEAQATYREELQGVSYGAPDA
jgi:hypothetical protein